MSIRIFSTFWVSNFASYNDDEPAAAKPAPAPEQQPAAPPAPAPADNYDTGAQESNDQYQPQQSYDQQQNGEDSYMNQQEEEDDDDEVDFNLGGNSNSHNAQHDDSQMSYGGQQHQGQARGGPNSKEDG